MRKNIVIVLALGYLLVFLSVTVAQFTSEEITEREKWEEFLETAEIVGEWKLGSREAVEAPWKLSLEKDGVRRDAIWKVQEGLVDGYLDSWKWEIVAYRMDKYLGLNMVPPTVEREFLGKRGSCQLWVTAKMDLRKMVREKIIIPFDKVYHWNIAIYLQRAFDNLIANVDRHMANILITKDWRMILIDHTRSFRSSEEFTTRLIYTEKHKDSPRIMRKLPRAFVEKLKTLNFRIIKEIVQEYLPDREIEAVLMRKDLILEEIDALIKKLGEEDVLYSVEKLTHPI